MVSLLPVVISALTLSAPTDPPPDIPAPSYALLVSPDRRVRAADSRVQTYLAEGLQRSPTFARLLSEINASDVIVYIERIMTLPRSTIGRLTMVPSPTRQRYLRIQIQSDLSMVEAIALIGHEMRHAVEVASAPTVRDTNGMIKLYESIGHSSGGDHVYDTTAAQAAGRQVKRELLIGLS
jgi:hypothetical protein